MRIYKLFAVSILCLFLSGCITSWVAKPPQVVLLPEERIFTVKTGQEITVLYDKQEKKMIFPEDMKLVSSTVLVRQEERLNNALLDKMSATKSRNKVLGIVGSIFAILAMGLGIFFKSKKWLPSIKGNIEVK